MIRLILSLALIAVVNNGFLHSAHADSGTFQVKAGQQVVKARVISIEWSEAQAWVRVEVEGKKKNFFLSATADQETIRKVEGAAESQKEIKIVISTSGQLKNIEAVIE